MKFHYNKIYTIEEATEFLKKPGVWVVANIKQQIGWPTKITLVEFRNHKLLLLPEDDTLLSCIAIRKEKTLTDNEARIIISHYLSSLAWVEGRSIYVSGWTGGGPHPFRMAKSSSASVVRSTFHYKYLPDPTDDKIRLALALYREALSLNNVAYSFLSYYKIINLRFTKGDDQKNWIDKNLKNITDKYAIKRRDELSKNEDSVSDYIYISCRCAIAHAGTEPTVNPENFDDEKRLNQDLPLIKNLAELMIENEFGIKSQRTVYKEHYYELYGFKKYIDSEIIENLKQGKGVLNKKIKLPDLLSIRLLGKNNYLPFEKMVIEKVTVKESEKLLNLLCKSLDSLVHFYLDLDFINEKLIIDPLQGIIIYDDKEEKTLIYLAEYYRFMADYFANGQLEVWDMENNECLSQCDAFIPVNIDLSKTIENFNRLEKLYRDEVNSRKNLEKS